MEGATSEITQLEINQWSNKLLLRLDWRRFLDVVRGVMSANGFTVSTCQIEADCSASMEIHRRVGNDLQPYGLVQTTPWLEPDAGVHLITRFRKKVPSSRNLKRIFVTPGKFKKAAQLTANTFGVELVDGCKLVELLCTLPSNYSNNIRQIAFQGSFDTPTCPYCSEKLVLINQPVIPATPLQSGKKKLRYKQNAIIPDDVLAYEIVVKKGVNIHFLRSVTAAKINIQGTVTGTLTALDSVKLGSSAVLTGHAIARTLQIDDGGIINGTTKIVSSGDLIPAQPVPPEPTWECNTYRHQGCETIHLKQRMVTPAATTSSRGLLG